MSEEISDGDETALPSIAVIMSPVVSPAEAAGPPETVPAIRAPALPASPIPLPPLATSTPRNAVAPTWTPADALPDSICLAIDIAVSIGMAYESLATDLLL